MSINTKELQRFHDVWGPMINSLPTVINATERMADLEKYLAELNAKADTVKVESQRELDLKNAQVSAANEQLNTLRAKKRQIESETDAALKIQKAKMAQIQSEVEAKVAECSDRVNAAQARAAQAEAMAAAMFAEADKVVADKMVELGKEVAAADKRVRDAETALDKLRAKLG